MSPTEFVRRLLPEARAAVRKHGLSDAVVPAILAQVALETGWLEHVSKDRRSGRDSMNLFNIKATSSWGGDTVEILTSEYVNGQRVRSVAEFRAYDSYQDSFEDYCQLITGLRRYRAAAKAKDPFTYAVELQRAGYATDPKYASKLHTIIRMILPIIERVDKEAGA